MNSSIGNFEVFFDGDCPLCHREIAMLRMLDKDERLVFTDIAEESFDAARIGKEFDSLMRTIHGRDAEGNWYKGVDVFRQIYDRVGFRKSVAFSRMPLVRHLLPVAYKAFAVWRYRSAMKRLRNKQCSANTCQPSGDSR